MAPKRPDDEQERKFYKEMSMNGKLRPMAKKAGFKNFNRWNQDQLVRIFLEYDRINQRRVRDISDTYTPSPAEIEAQHALVDRLIKENELTIPVPKRKSEDDAESSKGKRTKVLSEDGGHVSPSDSGKSNKKRAPGNVAGTKGVSKIGSRAGGLQKKSKQTEKPAATKPRSRQASTRKQTQKKKNMDVGNVQDEEPQNPPTPAVDTPFMTPGANPGDDDDSSESDDSDSGDDSGDEVHDDENIEENDEDLEAKEISKAPMKNKGTSKGKGKGEDTPEIEDKPLGLPLGLYLGVRKTGRYTSLDWDPLDESIPNSRLTWYEQEQRFRAQQEKAHKEAPKKKLPYNEGKAMEEEQKKEWDWKKQLHRKG